jgi:Negative regulator of beta-lactamase expression
LTYSSLATKIMSTTKRSSRGGAKIQRVIVHHWAGTSGGIERLVQSTDAASANYIILSDGTIIGSVPEEYRAWTSGSSAADNPSITVEVQNSTGAPNYQVSDAAIASLTRLIADVAKRYGFTPSRTTVKGHREFKATSCPGPYLYPRLTAIAADAAKRMGKTTTTTTTTTTASSDTWPGYVLKLDGDFGPYTKRALQTLLAKIGKYGRVVDGDFGVLSVKAMQNWLKGLGYYRRVVDGQWGAWTTKALQNFLKSKGLYTRVVDGDFGAWTVKALQSYLNDQRKYF